MDRCPHSLRRTLPGSFRYAISGSAFAIDRVGSWHHTRTRRNHRYDLLARRRSLRVVCWTRFRSCWPEESLGLRPCCFQPCFLLYISRFDVWRLSDSTRADGIGCRHFVHVCLVLCGRLLSVRRTWPSYGYSIDGLFRGFRRWCTCRGSGCIPPGMALGIRLPISRSRCNVCHCGHPASFAADRGPIGMAAGRIARSF